MLLFRNRFAVLFATLLALQSAGWAGAPLAYKWSVQYLIDNSQSIFGRSQEVYPRAVRGLAISPDGNSLYVAYNQSFNSGEPLRPRDARNTDTGEVRKIDLRVADFEDATKVVLAYHRAKAIAIDDQNRVYLAEGNTIEVYDANLKNVLLTLPADTCDGVAITREGGDTVLYATERDAHELHRFLIDTRFESNGAPGTPAGFGGNGVMKIPGAVSLRGVAVDSKGKVWMADEGANKVFRVDPDGKNLTSVDVDRPLGIAFLDDTALVTKSTGREIALVTLDMVVTGNLSVPWEELELSPYGNNHDGSLAGIAAIPGGKGFYVANEHGQTSNQKSTYGRTDQNSQIVDGKLYTDAFQDDNEPILRALAVTVEEPTPTPPPVASGEADKPAAIESNAAPETPAPPPASSPAQ